MGLVFSHTVFAQTTAAAPKKILIVPGHDDEHQGTAYLGVKESDMNVKLALYLRDLLAKDPNYEVHITRDWDGYTQEFAEYFETSENEINQFVASARQSHEQRITSGDFKRAEESVFHNDASVGMAHILYGINKWANDHAMDAVIHVHFNDYPRPRLNRPGVYKGFAVYVPDEQLRNGPKTALFAASVFASLATVYPVSTLPGESSGIVPEQELIALGSNGALTARSILIEYGYIYESKFNTFKKREKEMKKMAQLTYDGLKRYYTIVGVVPAYGN